MGQGDEVGHYLEVQTLELQGLQVFLAGQVYQDLAETEWREDTQEPAEVHCHLCTSTSNYPEDHYENGEYCSDEEVKEIEHCLGDAIIFEYIAPNIRIWNSSKSK